MGKKVTREPRLAGDGVPTHDTPPKPITPPSNHRHSVLPLQDLGSVAMETLCRDVLRYGFREITSAALKRDRGQRQFGVDVEGFNTEQRSIVVLSAKCYAEVKPRYLLPWTRDFSKHLDGHWQDKGVKHFVLAISVCRNDDELNEAVRACAAELAPHGITFHLWDALFITDLLREDVALVDRYFNEYWSKAISPRREPPAPLAGPNSGTAAASATILQLSQELVEVARQRDAAIAARLEAAQREFRAGRHVDLVQWFADLRANAALWDTLNAAIKSKATRARAMVALHLGDVPQAHSLLDEADALAPAPDRAPRALLTRVEKTAEEAVKLVNQPSSPRECEVKASLLLELGRVNEAFDVLDTISAPRSAEQLRIRAIAQCLARDREAAVSTAQAARDMEPISVSIQHTLAALHFAAALSGRAEPPFGSVPNPVNLGLIKRDKPAQQHLDRALAILEGLLPTVDPVLKSDFEVWKLAILIAHSDRRDEARRFSAELLSRTAPQPLVVAWSRMAALPVRLGKMRKALEDVLRKGSGSPAHVIVSAMLAADTNGEKAGANVISQHLAKFPEAREFLEGWRKRFAGETTGDLFSDAMHAALETRDYGSLLAFLTTPAATGGDILNAAQMFRARGEWQALRSLEAQLLSLRTPRAVELAVAAALRTSQAADAIRIIDDNADTFPDGVLPAGVQYLRSQANDALGHKHKAIRDLEAVALASDDPSLRLQLARSYISIGNLAASKQHAEAYLKSPGAKPSALIQVAEALKRSDPAFARELVVKAAADPRLPKALAPAVLVLAMETGIKDIERQMIEIVTNVEDYGERTHVKALSIPEVIEFLKAQSEKLRRQLSDWLEGKTPSHVCLQADIDGFAKLFLGTAEDRISQAGLAYPMLLRTGHTLSLAAAPAQTKPTLRIDISALLLAHRLDLIDKIDAACHVLIPPSLPLALVDLDSNLPAPSQDVITACKTALDQSSALLEISANPPADAVSLADPEVAEKINGPLLDSILKLAIEKGLVAADDRARTLAALGIDANALASIPPPQAILLNPATTVALASNRLLEAISQTLPTHITSDDRARLTRDIAQAERSISRRTSIAALRDLVASHLQAGRWQTLPAGNPSSQRKNGPTHRAHTASLVESLEAAEQASDGFFWIEDRAIQLGRHPRIISVLEVLALLEQRNAIAPIERQAAIAALRSWGYAYLPADTREFADKILAAPMHGESLVETPELRALRIWYAGEVDRLRHLDFQPQPDKDGRVGGEARHALNMLGAVAEVLRYIWNSPISVEEKQARSVWAWTCLRVEQTDYLPRNNRNNDGRVAVVSSTLSQIAMMGFLSAAEGNELAEDARQPFTTWFFQGVLVPRCANDPKLKDRVQDFIAAHLSNLFQLSFQGVSPQHARAYFATEANRYLNLLPQAWQHDLTRRHGLSDKLANQTILVVSVGAVQVPAAELNQALAQAITELGSGDAVSVPLVAVDSTKLQLILRKSATLLPTAQLICNGNAAELDAAFVALAHPDPAKRSAALAAMEDASDGPAARRRASMNAIASVEDPLERSQRFQHILSDNFARRRRKITEQLQEGNLHLEDLALPRPPVISTHLYVDPVFNQSGQELAVQCATALTAIHPLDAAARAAGLPFDLPTQLLAAIGAAVIRFRAARPDTRPRASSPLHALLVLRSVCAAGNAPSPVLADSIDDVVELTDRLARLFAAFVQYGAKVAAHDPDWSAVCDETALSLIWCWAHAMTSACGSTGADPVEATRVIHSLTPPDLASELIKGPRGPWFYAYADGINVQQLQAAIFASLLAVIDHSALSAEHATRIKQLVGHDAPKGWFPVLSLLFPPKQSSATFWPACDPVPSFVLTGWLPADSPFAIRDPNAIAGNLLRETDPSAPFNNTFLLSFAELEALDTSLRTEILQHLRALTYAPDTIATDLALQASLTFEARLLAVGGSADVMRMALRERAAALARHWPREILGYHALGDTEGAAYGFTWLYDTIFKFARAMDGSLSDKLRFLAAATSDIATAWPRSLRACIGVLNDSARFVDVEAAAGIWPTLLLLRQRSE